MSDLRIDRIPEKFRKDAEKFDDNYDKSLNNEELSCFCENMNITEDKLMGLIVEHEKDILKEGVVKPAGYVIGGAAILSGAAFFAETVLTKGRSKGKITKAITGFFKKGVNVFKKGVKKAATNEMVPKINENSKNTAKTIAKATAGAGLVGAVATGITSCNVDLTGADDEYVKSSNITQNVTIEANITIKTGENLTTLLSLLNDIRGNFNRIEELLKEIRNNNNTDNAHIRNLLAAIQNAISNLNDNVTAGNEEQTKLLKAILSKLSDINSGVINLTEAQADFATRLLNKLDKMDANQCGFAQKILDKLDKMDANQVRNAEALLDAVLQLKGNCSEWFNAVLNAIQNKSYPELQEILTAIRENTEVAQNTQAKITSLTVIFQAVMEDFRNQLEDAHDELAEKLNRNIKLLEEILNKIPSKIDTVDLSQILDKLDELLQCCQANQNGGNCGNHEGILDDLEEMLS